MTATDELRRLLDERGVEWEAWNDCITVAPPSTHYLEVSNGTLCVAIVDATPEQAVEATLGPGTCKLSRGTSGLMHVTTGHCSECGAEVVKGTKDGYRSRYCQWCGAKVVQE